MDITYEGKYLSEDFGDIFLMRAFLGKLFIVKCSSESDKQLSFICFASFCFTISVLLLFLSYQITLIK